MTDKESALNFQEQVISYLSSKQVSSDDFIDFFLKQDSTKKILSFLDYEFDNNLLFIESMTHRSFSHEFSAILNRSNERLEFLGDAAIGMIVSKEIYKRYPTHEEGVMSRLKSALVNAKTLSRLATSFNLEECILIGRGEIKSLHGDGLDTIVSSALEALCGAVLIDSSEDVFSKFWNNLILKYEQKINDNFYSLDRLNFFDPKSRLQEQVMKFYGVFPTYLSKEVGKQLFEVTLMINNKEILKKTGNSKKKLQEQLATQALENEFYKKI